MPRNKTPLLDKVCLQKALEKFLMTASQPFSFQEVAKKIFPQIQKLPKNLASKLKLGLTESALLFCDEKEYLPRSYYFHKKQFRIAPRAQEIEEGVLVPGHRFLPFCFSRVLPVDCTILWPKEKPLGMKEVLWKWNDMTIYHTLMGWAQMMLYIMLQSDKNHLVLPGENLEKKQVTLKVYDMQAFYKKYNFQVGDTILLTIEDWKEGIYTAQYSPLSEFESHKTECEHWQNYLEKALEIVFERFGTRINVDEQFAQAFFLAGEKIFDFPGYSIGNFLERSQKIELTASGMSSILWYKGVAPSLPENDEGDNDEQADLLALLSGDEEDNPSFQNWMEDLKTPPTEEMLKVYILDELYHGRKKLDIILSRSLGCLKGVSFDTAAQKEEFHRFIKKLWLKVEKNYRLPTDKYAGKCRSRLLEILCLYDSLEYLYVPEEKLSDIAKEFDHLLQLREEIEAKLIRYNAGDEGYQSNDCDEIEGMAQKFQSLKESLEKKCPPRSRAKGTIKSVKERPEKKSVKESTKKTSASIYQLKISLLETEPRIWRIIQIRTSTTLEELHRIIQNTMGWENKHGYFFEIGGKDYREEDLAKHPLPLSDLIQPKTQKFFYTYDLQDNWEHIIEVEKIVSPEKGKRYPLCIDGANACPPERCGGILGYETLLVQSEKGSDRDSHFFDLGAVNKKIQKER